MSNQKKEAGVDVKLIEEKEFDTSYFDEIKTIGSENFCFINNAYLIIFKLNQLGVREECEITFDTEKIQAAKSIISELTTQSGKHKDFNYSDLTSFLNENYFEESDQRYEYIESRYEAVRRMIALAELENALIKLQDIVKGDKDFEDRVIIQLTRYHDNKKKIQNGVIELSAAAITTNQISEATLQLIEEFKNAEYKNNANNALNANRRQKPTR